MIHVPCHLKYIFLLFLSSIIKHVYILLKLQCNTSIFSTFPLQNKLYAKKLPLLLALSNYNSCITVARHK